MGVEGEKALQPGFLFGEQTRADLLTDKQRPKFDTALQVHDAHAAVEVT